jgi:hypothetical protein
MREFQFFESIIEKDIFDSAEARLNKKFEIF